MRPDRKGVSTGEAARRIGIPAPTLRSWDRRYGLGPVTRDQGRHRRFSQDDLDRLLVMRRLTETGVPAAQAAQHVRRSTNPRALLGGFPGQAPVRQVRRADAPRAVRAIERAALALDQVRLNQLLQECLADGVAVAWTEVMTPALQKMGERTVATGQQIEAEHLLSVATSYALARVPRSTKPAKVLLACGPDELHTLAFEALDAALAEHGMSARLLGARVPAESLEASVVRTGPRAVALWAHAHELANHRQLQALLSLRPRPPLVMVAGPGWRDFDEPGVLNPGSLNDAIKVLTAL